MPLIILPLGYLSIGVLWVLGCGHLGIFDNLSTAERHRLEIYSLVMWPKGLVQLLKGVVEGLAEEDEED